jgi:hypothetical protein
VSFEDSQFRKALADSALGSMRLEGLEPPPDAEAMFSESTPAIMTCSVLHYGFSNASDSSGWVFSGKWGTSSTDFWILSSFNTG